MPLAPALGLLEELAGSDIAKMSDSEADAFRDRAFQQFKNVIAAAPALFFGDQSGHGWVWAATKPEFASEWIGRLRFVHTAQMEANLGEHERIQMAAALFPPISFDIDLFGDFHYRDDGTGLQSVPRYLLALNASGEPELGFLAEMVIEASPAWHAMAADGVRLSVVCAEDAADIVEEPENVGVAFRRAATAARLAAESEHGDSGLAETVSLWVEVYADAGVELFSQVLSLCGATMRAVASGYKGS
jgi:hypothetical protein